MPLHVHARIHFQLSIHQYTHRRLTLHCTQRFAANLSKGDVTESNQRLYFNLTFSSRTPGLFVDSPEVDENGRYSGRVRFVNYTYVHKPVCE